jgi:hypothetical protein
MLRTAVALPLVLFALAGCAAETTGRGALAATTAGGVASTSARPSPTPTAMTLAQAGAAYQALVTPSNEAGHKVNLALHAYLATPTKASFLALTTATGQLADAEEQYLTGLRKTRWPVAVQPSIDALVTALGAEIDGLRRLADAADPTAYGAGQAGAKKANSEASAKAEVVRQKLGLDKVPDISSGS